MTWAIRSRHSLQKSDCGQFAQVAHEKRVTMSDLHRTCMTKEWRNQFALFHKWIALSLFPSQKMSKLLEKPMSKFPTLIYTQFGVNFYFIIYLGQLSRCTYCTVHKMCSSSLLYLLILHGVHVSWYSHDSLGSSLTSVYSMKLLALFFSLLLSTP